MSAPARFNRLKPCDVTELIASVALAEFGQFTVTDLADKGLENPLHTAHEVGLIEIDSEENVTVSNEIPWVTQQLRDIGATVVADNGFDSELEAIASKQGQEKLAESVLDAGGLYSEWFDFVIDSVPEVAEFAQWFNEGTTGEVGFKHYDELLAKFDTIGIDDSEGILSTVMAFGRLAGMVTEKYHVFVKPPHQVFLCRQCDELTRDKRCSSCQTQNLEIQFCKRCHHPYIEVETAGEEETFRPLDHIDPVDKCPGCGQWPKLTDIGVPTSSLLSYMLTEVCRTSPSKKTLVFSDSHSAAESVGDRIIGTEYSLMAQSLYIQELIENDGTLDNYKAFRNVSDRLREEYWEPLMQNEIDEDGTAFNFLRTFLDDIEGHAMLHNAEELLDSALITTETIAEIEDPEELVIAHETFKLFAKDPSIGFTKNRVKFDGLPLPKIVDRVAKAVWIRSETVQSVMPSVLQRLLDKSIIVEQPWEEVRQAIINSPIEDVKKENTFDYLDQVATNSRV